MECFHAYREPLADVFADAAAEAARFPEKLIGIAQSLVGSCNPLHGGVKSNYIAYLLPYWTDELTRRGEDVCRSLATGSVFAMIHYFIIDDLMDEGTTAFGDVRSALAAGQLFHASFQARYARIAAPGSPVWDAYARYAEEWADAVSREGDMPVDPHNAKRLAGKSAPVKLGAAALLLGTPHAGRLAEIEEAVELALAVLQLTDDWQDWKNDLPSPNGNAFLSIVRKCIGLNDDEVLVERDVRRAIYREGAVRRLADIAEGYAVRMRVLRPPSMLSTYLESLADGLRLDAEQADSLTRSIIRGGGLSYLMSNLEV